MGIGPTVEEWQRQALNNERKPSKEKLSNHNPNVPRFFKTYFENTQT